MVLVWDRQRVKKIERESGGETETDTSRKLSNSEEMSSEPLVVMNCVFVSESVSECLHVWVRADLIRLHDDKQADLDEDEDSDKCLKYSGASRVASSNWRQWRRRRGGAKLDRPDVDLSRCVGEHVCTVPSWLL